MSEEERKELEKLFYGFSRYFYKIVLSKIKKDNRLYDLSRETNDSIAFYKKAELKKDQIPFEDEYVCASYKYLKEFILENSLESQVLPKENIVDYVHRVKKELPDSINNYFRFFDSIEFNQINDYSIFEIFDNYEIFFSVEYLVEKPFVALDIYKYVLNNIHKVVDLYRDLSDPEYSYIDDLLSFFYSLMQRRMVEAAKDYQGYLSLAAYLEKLEIFDYFQLFDDNLFVFSDEFISNLLKAVQKNQTNKSKYLSVFLKEIIKCDENFLADYKTIMPGPFDEIVLKVMNYYLFNEDEKKVRNLLKNFTNSINSTDFEIYKNRLDLALKNKKYCSISDIENLLQIDDDNIYLTYLENKSSLINYNYFINQLCKKILDEKKFSIRSYNTILYFRSDLSLTYLNKNLKYIRVENSKEYFALSILLFDRKYIGESSLIQRTLLEKFIEEKNSNYYKIERILYNQIKASKDFLQYQTEKGNTQNFLDEIKKRIIM